MSCLMMYGVEFESTIHTFSTPGLFSSFESSYTIAHLNDGTDYTCSGALFTDNGGICLQISKNGEVVISPAFENLDHVQILHDSGTFDLEFYVSTDGTSWTPIEDVGGRLSTTPSTTSKTVEGLSGNYYFKVVNTTKNAIAIRTMKYYTRPCRCLRVVVSE